MKTKQKVNVGIDVGKHDLDMFIHETQAERRFPNSETGFRQLRRALSAFEVERIVVEATGRMERLILE